MHALEDLGAPMGGAGVKGAGERVAGIEKRGDSWRVNWRRKGRDGKLVRDSSGKAPVQSTTWPSEELALRARDIAEGHHHEWTAAQVYEAILGPSDDHSSGALTLSQWFEEFLPSKTRITQGTRAGYAQQFRDHIAPTLGDKPIDLITAVDVGKWINKRREAGVRNTTITREFTLLSQTLKAALKQGLIPRNPCVETDFVRDQKEDDDVGEERREKYLTRDEYERVRAAFHPRWHLLLDFFVETGARWSEATALTVGHLIAPVPERSEASVRIWQAWKRTGKGDEAFIGVTKGRRKRTVPIDEELYVRLAEATKGKGKTDLVFPGQNGDRLHYSNFWNRVWVPALVGVQRCPEHPPPRREEHVAGASGRCGDFGGRTDKGTPCGARVPTGFTRCTGHQGPDPSAVSTCDCPEVVRLDGEPYGPHLLRHSFASWMFDEGVPQLVISRLLGHSSTRVTDETYGHRLQTSDETVREALQRVKAKRK
ncbi:tyrosine-type recombinase/integrase [Micromonospora sp. NPDC049366]|uniref:tyrosine-type recombinase/integrase n=1 Tax=Micromonospora sp. NPDC049366 TaxID=3364271 RepID=UPI00379EE89D